MDTPWRVALSIFAATVLTPIITHALSHVLPPRQSDTVEADSLSRRYRSLELWSQLAAVIGVVGAVALLILLRVGNTPWLLGVVFGWPVLVAILFIGVFTLPHGLSRWREFWRFYKCHYRITLRFLAPLYATLCALGLLSTAVLLSRV
jgi:hypothetical protein